MSDVDTYKLGWDDGYAEGYACKLADATEPFNPAALNAPDIVERVADHIARKYVAHFDRMAALGLARAMLKIAGTPHQHGAGNGEKRGG